GRLRDDRHRSGRKTLAQRAKSGDLEVKRQATWEMSVVIVVLFQIKDRAHREVQTLQTQDRRMSP
ncbi:hypothetical protein ACFOMH_20495, partial [Paracoccus mangrovi]